MMLFKWYQSSNYNFDIALILKWHTQDFLVLNPTLQPPPKPNQGTPHHPPRGLEAALRRRRSPRSWGPMLARS
jgi:hypothetical protein